MPLPIQLRRISFNPSNWYWIVAASTTQVYSSAAVAYVPVAEATYVAWLAAGNVPTKIAVEQDLWDVLYSNGIALPNGATPSDAEKTILVNKMDTIAFRIMFNHENRIRTLASQPQVTAAQFIAAIKALL